MNSMKELDCYSIYDCLHSDVLRQFL